MTQAELDKELTMVCWGKGVYVFDEALNEFHNISPDGKYITSANYGTNL